MLKILSSEYRLYAFAKMDYYASTLAENIYFLDTLIRSTEPVEASS